jgi:hypothetical protein
MDSRRDDIMGSRPPISGVCEVEYVGLRREKEIHYADTYLQT